MENTNLATELLHEVKSSAKRWFYIAMAELIVIVILVVLMFTVPVDEVSVENEDGNANYIGRDLNGGLTYGENSSEEETGTQNSE